MVFDRRASPVGSWTSLSASWWPSRVLTVMTEEPRSSLAPCETPGMRSFTRACAVLHSKSSTPFAMKTHVSSASLPYRAPMLICSLKFVRNTRSTGLDDVIVFGGGIIPEDDRPALHQVGIRAVFGPGTPTAEILEFITEASGRDDAGVGQSTDWRWESSA